MAVDATGSPTPLGIPKFNTAVDAPSGKGSNAQMDAIDTLIASVPGKPTGILSGETIVYNGTTFVRSSATKLQANSLTGTQTVVTGVTISAANTDYAWPGGDAISTTVDIGTGGGSVRTIGPANQGNGSRLVIRNGAGTSITFLHNITGSGLVVLTRDGATLTLANGETAEFVQYASAWVEVGRDKPAASVLFDSGYLGAAAATIDTGAGGFSTAFTHLRVRVIGRGDTAANTFNVLLQINGDNAANYDYQTLTGNAATASASEGIGQSTILVGALPAASATAAKAGVLDIVIPFYSATTFHKEGVTKAARSIGNATSNQVVEDKMFVWRNTAAIVRLSFSTSAGNYAAGSRIVVYGEN